MSLEEQQRDAYPVSPERGPLPMPQQVIGRIYDLLREEHHVDTPLTLRVEPHQRLAAYVGRYKAAKAVSFDAACAELATFENPKLQRNTLTAVLIEHMWASIAESLSAYSDEQNLRRLGAEIRAQCTIPQEAACYLLHDFVRTFTPLVLAWHASLTTSIRRKSPPEYMETEWELIRHHELMKWHEEIVPEMRRMKGLFSSLPPERLWELYRKTPEEVSTQGDTFPEGVTALPSDMNVFLGGMQTAADISWIINGGLPTLLQGKRPLSVDVLKRAQRKAMPLVVAMASGDRAVVFQIAVASITGPLTKEVRPGALAEDPVTGIVTLGDPHLAGTVAAAVATTPDYIRYVQTGCPAFAAEGCSLLRGQSGKSIGINLYHFIAHVAEKVYFPFVEEWSRRQGFSGEGSERHEVP